MDEEVFRLAGELPTSSLSVEVDDHDDSEPDHADKSYDRHFAAAEKCPLFIDVLELNDDFPFASFPRPASDQSISRRDVTAACCVVCHRRVWIGNACIAFLVPARRKSASMHSIVKQKSFKGSYCLMALLVTWSVFTPPRGAIMSRITKLRTAHLCSYLTLERLGL